MKKISHYFKIVFPTLSKMIIGALVGMILGMGLGKQAILEEKKNNKNVEAKK
ncbi:hypothetical protein KKC83_03625 [Patescibacteria group bacterium]|nr:hypothetical protein [Patescibacteria group bacterium]MCG2698587.1 hypothetical protein [Candidatus Parcubacteria bacterium]MBU4014845.1 hypothetical protein [Patescibacteria group bacterium]MBU4026603.1 hypothetical protein [Patescibacteria group bacterium]MBU4073502.1 hypothetical protein [Patescibacteria group bacterium]